MKKNNKILKIVFIGTPEFAEESLKILVENGKEIVGVITAPDKPQGRGRKIIPSAVKQYAVSKGLKVLQPINLKDEQFQAELRALNADLQIVVAFRMLPEAVWSMPPLGTFNLHASLLPNYRGAAPINWAIINGETETGISTFFLKHEIDTGDLIMQAKEKIKLNDNAGTLYTRLMYKGAKLVLNTVNKIESGSYKLRKQKFSPILSDAPKIYRDTCKINWSQNTMNVFNFIRGLSPYPTAWTVINGKTYKIFKVELIPNRIPPAEFKTDNKTYLEMGTKDGAVSIVELQAEGKKRMIIDEFFRGNSL